MTSYSDTEDRRKPEHALCVFGGIIEALLAKIQETLLVRKRKDYFSIELKLMEEGVFDPFMQSVLGLKASIVTNMMSRCQ